MKQKLNKQSVKFTQIKNEVLTDKNLSLKAKGLFAYLYSKPNNWDFSMYRIAGETKDGKEGIRTALLELEKNGYLTRKRLASGKMEYYITYEPSSENRQKPSSEKANKGKSQQGKIGTISNIVNKVIKNNSNKETSEIEISHINEIMNIFYKINPTLNWGNKTTRSSAEFLIKRFGIEKAKRIASAAVACQGEPYAPVVTTPYQLKEKLTQLKIFYDRKRKAKKPSVAVIS